MTTPITREALAAKLNAGEPLTVIEALPAKYYAKAHLPGAINIPHDEIETLAARLLPDKARAIVVYCADTACANSRIAAETLTRLGYSNVREYVEGKAHWIEAGLPTEGLRESA